MRKTALVTFFLLIMLSLQMPIAQNAASTSNARSIEKTLSNSFGGKVLVDESHTGNASEMWTPGNASMFGWILAEHDYDVSMNWNSSLDSDILDDFDVLCLFFPYTPLTTQETNAIHDFVEDGGGLLLVGIEPVQSSWGYSAENLNPVSSTYGIQFADERWRGRVLRSEGELVDHHITTDVSSFHSNADQLSGCKLSLTGSAISLASSDGDDVLAVAESGSGRVVAIGGLAPFTQYRKNVGWQVDKDDHSQLTVNILDWLTKSEQRAVDLPERAIIKVGTGPDLAENEIAEYEVFNGAYHDHTTASDGLNPPSEMAVRNVEVQQDFFVLTDHSYENPAGGGGIIGALEAREFTQKYGLDSEIFIGAELSGIPHSVGFPLTEQIYTADTQTAVDEIHAQGGIAVFCHPTIGYPYVSVWENFEEYGYDAFEVDNSGFIHGLGEQAYFWPFMGASDGHSASKLGRMRNVVFVKNPSGPGGSISAQDLIDAVLNKRIVILDRYNDLIFGQGVWVDRFLAIQDSAETAIDDAESQIEALEGDGYDMSLSRLYLENAKSALDWWNPSRALAYINNATSNQVKDIGLDLVSENIGVIEPNGQATAAISLSNRLENSLEVNVTPFISTALNFSESSKILAAASGATESVEFVAEAESYGYTKVGFSIGDFNVTDTLKPLILYTGGIIDNVTTSIESVSRGLNVTVYLLQNIEDRRMVSSVNVTYSDRTGNHTVEMNYRGGRYKAVLGPFRGNMNMTIQVSVEDKLGNVFLLEPRTIPLPSAPGVFDPIMLAVIGVAVVAIVAVIFVFMRKKGKI